MVDVRLAAPASVAPLVAFMRSSGDGPRTQPFTVGFFRAAADWYAPQRPEPDSRCLVIERQRPKGLVDAFQWHCAACGGLVQRIEVQLGDSRTEVNSFVREPRPQVQQRLNLPHAMYGFRILLPMPAGVQPAQVRDLVQVRGGKDAASLSPPFRTDPIKPKAGA